MSWSQFSGENQSGANYQSFKEKALNNTILRKTIAFSDFEILDEQTVFYAGNKLLMTETAFKNLVGLIGITSQSFKNLNAQLGDKATKSLISLMKESKAKMQDKNTVCICIDTKSLQVVNFLKNATGVLSNKAFFGLFEDVMQNHTGMEIKNMSITAEGNVEISVINNNWEFNVGNFKEEYFKSGLVFINTPDCTIVNPFNERLTCTNGMVVSEKGMSLILKNADNAQKNAFFDQVRNIPNLANFEMEFKKRISVMMQTVASYAELKEARTNAEYCIANMADPDVSRMVESFLPTREVWQAFMAHQIDLGKLDHKHYSKIRTPFTVWELVNKMTDLSSHPKKYGFVLKEGNASMFMLQREAGALAFKQPAYDLESPVKQIF